MSMLMNPYSGEIAEIYLDEGTTMANVVVKGVLVRVPLTLVMNARVGDSVLIESGVAIGTIERTIIAEEKCV